MKTSKALVKEADLKFAEMVDEASQAEKDLYLRISSRRHCSEQK